MARSDKMYKNSPSIKKNEEGQPTIERGKKEPMKETPREEKSEDVAAGVDDMHGVSSVDDRHAHERRDMHHRHIKEHLDMHNRHEMEHAHEEGHTGPMHERHEREYGEMHGRHEKEMKVLHDRQEKEGDSEEEGHDKEIKKVEKDKKE